MFTFLFWAFVILAAYLFGGFLYNVRCVSFLSVSCLFPVLLHTLVDFSRVFLRSSTPAVDQVGVSVTGVMSWTFWVRFRHIEADSDAIPHIHYLRWFFGLASAISQQ